MDLSIVIPLFNEEESLGELISWIDRVLTKSSIQSWEVIFVDDGSTDHSWDEVKKISQNYTYVHGISFRRNYGKSAALYVGFDNSKGDVVITMDADLQDSPDEIPELYRLIKEEGYDIVSGWKKLRHDPWHKRWPSKFFNYTARLVSGIHLHDFNCGLKSYRGKVIKSIEVYGEMHRYIPILAKKAGFKKITEKVVDHHARKYGHSKFGLERMVKGYLDLIGVMFMSTFGRRPLYIFGSTGTIMFLIGIVISIILIAEKLSLQGAGLPARPVTDQPLFFIALTCAIIGVQLFVAGFLGEIVNRTSSDRNKYLIEDKL